MFPAEPIPDQIGAYKVVRRLATAGSLETYLCRVDGPMGFQRDCVLKLMADSSEGSGRFGDELAREAAICARMNHPNIVRMIDFFEHEKKLALVLEHIEGETLATLLEHLGDARRKLGDPAIFYIGHQIAGALAHAHAATDDKGKSEPVVHRNVHPESVLVGLDGQVRLTGFGVGKILGRSPDTAVGTVKGRPGYMAPEQVRGEAVTPKADVYVLGLLLWSLFTGRKPPTGAAAPARLRTLRADLSREIVAMIDASLDRLPATRKITAREMEQWLAKVVPADKGRAELATEVEGYRKAHPSQRPPEDDDEETATELHETRDMPTRAMTFLNPPARRPSEPVMRTPTPVPTTTAPTTTTSATKPAPTTTAPKVIPPPLPAATPELDAFMPTAASPPAPAAASPPAASPAPVVRFGPPPAGMPPPPPLRGTRSDDWRQLLPDIDNVDALFENAKAPRADGARESTPGPPPAPLPVPVANHGARAAAAVESTSSVTLAASPAALARVTSDPDADLLDPPTAVEGPPRAPLAAAIAPRTAVLTPMASAALTVPENPIVFTPAADPPWPASSPALAPLALPSPARLPMDTDLNRSAIAPAAPPTFSPMPASSPLSAPTFKTPKTLPPPPDTDAPPRPTLPWKGRRSPRSASLGTTIAVSAITATVVVIVSLYFLRRSADAPASADATVAIASAPASAAPPPPPPSPAAPQSAPIAPTSTAAPTANGAELPVGYGYLFVTHPTGGEVFGSGKSFGPANQPLKVNCGRWYLRLASPGAGRYPEWISGGQTVTVRCQNLTTVELPPMKSGPKRP